MCQNFGKKNSENFSRVNFFFNHSLSFSWHLNKLQTTEKDSKQCNIFVFQNVSSSDVNCVLCVCPLMLNGSLGMQLGNLLSVFHIMWHVYDPNKFRMSIFLLATKIYCRNNFSIYLRWCFRRMRVFLCASVCVAIFSKKMTISQVELGLWESEGEKKAHK